MADGGKLLGELLLRSMPSPSWDCPESGKTVTSGLTVVRIWTALSGSLTRLLMSGVYAFAPTNVQAYVMLLYTAFLCTAPLCCSSVLLPVLFLQTALRGS